MAAREDIDHVLYHQAPPHKNPRPPLRPVSELLTPSSYSEAVTDEYSDLWIQAMQKKHGGLENAGTFGAIWQPNSLNILAAKWGISPFDHLQKVNQLPSQTKSYNSEVLRVWDII